MLFALLDYRKYRARSARFSRDYRKSVMGAAFSGKLPNKALQALRPGDVLFVETFESFPSWLVMYLTQSEISHVAFYVGKNQIAHSTFSGVVIEPIESLFGPDTRILPCIWPIPDDKRESLVSTLKSNYEGVPYGWQVVAMKGMNIFLGRDWPYYRWKFMVDTGILLGALDFPIVLIFGYPLFSWLFLTYVLIIVANRILWKFKPLPFDENTGKPSQLLSILCEQGATIGFDAYEIQQQKKRHMNE